MPFNSQGTWIPEDDSVSTKLTALTASDSPYIAQARQGALAGANRRGLLNSSMAQGAAEGAAISAALPIASQDASQVAQKNLAAEQGGYSLDQQKLVTAAADRNASLTAALQSNQTYNTAFTDIAQNKDIPAATRDAYIKNLQDTRNSGMDLIQQIYGINLNWGQPGAPSSGAYGVVPTNDKGVQGGGGGYGLLATA
jgi:hypothetical protein